MSTSVPDSWAVVRLGDVADVQLGKMLSPKARGGRGARPYLRNVNVRWHRINTSDVLEMDFDEREVEKYRLHVGDVLVCEGGEPGRAAVWHEQLPGALYQKALHRVRFRGKVLDPRLLTYQLELAAGDGSLARSFTGSTIKHLPRESFVEWRLAIPPLAEQHRIVAALEELLSDLDAAVTGLQRGKANAERYIEALRDAAASGRLLGEGNGSAYSHDAQTPDGWQWTTVGECAAREPNAITDGPFGSKLKTEHYVSDGPRVIRGGLRILDSRDRWKSALHEAILSPTRRLFPDATTPTEPLANIQGQGGFGCA